MISSPKLQLPAIRLLDLELIKLEQRKVMCRLHQGPSHQYHPPPKISRAAGRRHNPSSNQQETHSLYHCGQPCVCRPTFRITCSKRMAICNAVVCREEGETQMAGEVGMGKLAVQQQMQPSIQAIPCYCTTCENSAADVEERGADSSAPVAQHE